MEKNPSQTKSNEKKPSICDIMKKDTSEIIKNMESKIPSLFQNYSDLYMAYLHMFDDLFGACYIAEKEYLETEHRPRNFEAGKDKLRIIAQELY